MNVRWYRPRCRWCEKRMNLLAANALDADERKILENHLAHCSSCQSRWQTIRLLITRLETIGRELPQFEVPNTLRSKWQTTIHRLPAPAFSNRNARQTVFPSHWEFWWPAGQWLWKAVSACWILIALLHLTAPSVVKPASEGSQITFQEMMLVLKNNGSSAPPNPASSFKGLHIHPQPKNPPHRSLGRTETHDV